MDLQQWIGFEAPICDHHIDTDESDCERVDRRIDSSKKTKQKRWVKNLLVLPRAPVDFLSISESSITVEEVMGNKWIDVFVQEQEADETGGNDR